ncbi:MAG: FAD-dependent thymidylate synthase [Candidatus Hadarchaeum sp.]|uniref:FAD-dependent thymidylate synthase n=1 Tax=Candidatus Hadarchaeum sp. TaxID=2883567 RepID=UPI00316C4270
MKVKLIAHTPDPDALAGAAARSCRSTKPADEIVKEERSKLLRSLEVCVERGHESVIEHASFTFSVEGVSRACTHELVRHRIASYSQQSQRAVKLEKNYIVPPTISKDREAEKIFIAAMDAAWRDYLSLIERGIPVEDARYLLPNAAAANIVVTMNARALMNFFKLRCCTHAQWEIRELAYEMLKLVKKVAPKIFENAGPSCVMAGKCPENDESCPLYPKAGKRPELEKILQR